MNTQRIISELGTSITVSSTIPTFPRGAIVLVGGTDPYRVTRATGTTLTVRSLHRRRWLEALHTALESFVIYPWRDTIERLRARWTRRS